MSNIDWNKIAQFLDKMHNEYMKMTIEQHNHIIAMERAEEMKSMINGMH